MFPNRIRLSHYDPPNEHAVKTEINGVEMREVRNIRLDCPAGEFPMLTLEQWAYNGLDVTLEGDAVIQVFATAPYTAIEVEQIAPGKIRYRMVRDDAYRNLRATALALANNVKVLEIEKQAIIDLLGMANWRCIQFAEADVRAAIAAMPKVLEEPKP